MIPDLMELGGISAVLAAAWQHGLLQALHAGPPARAEELAARLGIDAEATGLVLEALAAFGVAARDDEGRWGVSDALSEQIGRWPGGLEGVGALWSHVPRFLQDGTRFRRMDGQAPDRQAEYAGVVEGLGRLFGDAAADLAGRLPATAGGLEILDVGAGSGVWSLAMAERDPAARVTALDLPGVLPNFEARAARLGLADRVATLPGDFHAVELPEAAFDRVVLANVLHLEPAPSAAALVRRVARAVRPGGQVVVIDVLGQGEPARERARALYSLHLTMRTEKGRNHPRAEVEAWCVEAGLRPQALVVTEKQPAAMAALVASR